MLLPSKPEARRPPVLRASLTPAATAAWRLPATYLLLRRGKEAAAEFQKLVAYRLITANSPLAALTSLQLARAYGLQGDVDAARIKYQEFLTAWRDADVDIPVLVSARSEFARLQSNDSRTGAPRTR